MLTQYNECNHWIEGKTFRLYEYKGFRQTFISFISICPSLYLTSIVTPTKHLKIFSSVIFLVLFWTNLHYYWCKFSLIIRKHYAVTETSQGAIYISIKAPKESPYLMPNLHFLMETKRRFNAHFTWEVPPTKTSKRS